MANTNDTPEQPEKKRRFSQKQYELLKRCSDDRDITEWRQYRKDHPDEEILLEGADLSGAYLKGVDLEGGQLEGANLTCADLKVALLSRAHLKNAHLDLAHLEGAQLDKACLEGAEFEHTHLEDAYLHTAHLKGASLRSAHLERANLNDVCLKGAQLTYAHLEGADLTLADLRGAVAHAVRIDGTTINKECLIDRETDFSLVGLDSARIDSGLKGLLEYNIRRKAWEKWYWERYWHQLVRPFWWASDYGRSTGRVIASFLILSLLFAGIYFFAACCSPPGIVRNLAQTEVVRDGQVFLEPIPGRFLLFFRAAYFSVVTMTTLGFGDMYAHPDSLVGHVLLTCQVILGYVLLGALVTRLNILFTTGGPTPGFAKEPPVRKRDAPREATTDDKPPV